MTTTMDTIRRVLPAISTEGWRAIFWLALSAAASAAVVCFLTFPGLLWKHLLRHRSRGGLWWLREDRAGSGIFASAGGAGCEAGGCL